MTVETLAPLIGGLALALGVAVFVYNHRRNRADVAVVAVCQTWPGCLDVMFVVTKHGMTPIQVNSVGLAWLDLRWVLSRQWPPVQRAGVITHIAVGSSEDDDRTEAVLAFDGQILRRIAPIAQFRRDVARFGRLPDRAYAAGPARAFYGPIEDDLARCLRGDCG